MYRVHTTLVNLIFSPSHYAFTSVSVFLVSQEECIYYINLARRPSLLLTATLNRFPLELDAVDSVLELTASCTLCPPRFYLGLTRQDSRRHLRLPGRHGSTYLSAPPSQVSIGRYIYVHHATSLPPKVFTSDT